MTVTELARRTGVTPAAVVQWENGTVVPATGKLPVIAAVLECEVGELYDAEVLREAGEAARAAVAKRAAADAQKLLNADG